MTPLSRLLFFGMILTPGLSLLAQSTTDHFSDRRIIVKFRDQVSAGVSSRTRATTGIASVDAIAHRYALQRVESAFPPAQNADEQLRTSLGMDRILVLTSDSPVDVRSAVREFSNDPAIEYAEPDYSGTGAGVRADSMIPTDTYFSRQWGFRNTRQPGADIKAINAWPIEKGDSATIVGVLDSGLKWVHPDISARVWNNKKEIAGNGIDDDGNGYADDIRGWNFAYNTNDVKDDYGHGTNTASIIGATSNNGLGYAGLDWACKILPVKVLDSTDFGYYTWWSAGIYYAVNNGARVINMSLVGNSYSPTLETAASYAFLHRCLIAAAMGNSNDSTRWYPAYFSASVIAVGATNWQDHRASPFFWGGGSCYGSWIDVCAPGDSIYGLNNLSTNDYSGYWGGTSQATPMVAGLAALLLAQDSTRSPATLKTIIRNTSDDMVGRATEDTPGFDVFHGYGRINCYRALTYGTNSVEEDRSHQPVTLALFANYPNPFNPTTELSYGIPGRQYVTLKIFDILGREVGTLVDEMREPGLYTARWDASRFSSGTYISRLTAGQLTQTRLMVLVK